MEKNRKGNKTKTKSLSFQVSRLRLNLGLLCDLSETSLRHNKLPGLGMALLGREAPMSQCVRASGNTIVPVHLNQPLL